MSTTTLNPATIRRIVRAGTASSFGSRPGMRRHQWSEVELQELSLAYLEHSRQMPLFKIADMLHYSFSFPKSAASADADDVPYTPRATASNTNTAHTRVPRVSAIMLKLMSCLYLETGGELGYECLKPSQLHTQVWEHVIQAQKHREITKAMKMSAAEAATATATATAKGNGSIWNVHRHEFLYDTVEEYEAAFPPAKRRKIINDDDDNDDDNEHTTATTTQQVEPIVGEIEMGDEEAPASEGQGFEMGEICQALDEIAHQIDEREQERQRNNHAIQESLANIRAHERQIAALLTNIRDATAEIETHRQAIALEMEKMESSFTASVNTIATAATATPSAAATPLRCLGPLAHATNSTFDPNHYQCRPCAQMFDPRNGGFWLIGPNRETGDTFYICHECTAFMDETTPTAAATAAPTAALPLLSQRIDEECGCGCGCGDGGDCDCWDSDYEYDNYDEEPRQGDYDHSEECS